MDQSQPSQAEHFTRPAGVTFLAGILALLTAGYFLSFVRTLPDDALLIDGLVNAFSADGFTQVIRLVLAGCAGVASVGLWHMKPWALGAYALFAVVLVGAHAVKDAAAKLQGKTESEWWAIVLAWVVIAIVVGLIGLGLKKTLKR